jgi:hypothetical protein
MIKQISEGAGEVWRYLEVHGPTSPATLKKQLKMGSEVFYGALGWLAREEKINIEGQGRKVTVALR